MTKKPLPRFGGFPSSGIFIFTVFTSCFIQKTASVFYVPGVSPESWAVGDEIILNVNKITSVKTLIPYEYYYLPFCSPAHTNEKQENLGEIISGDAIKTSLYSLKMKEDTKCIILCPVQYYKKEQLDMFRDKIKDEYYAHWIVDNLPVLYKESAAAVEAPMKRGFPIGNIDSTGKYYLYNHVKIIISVNKDPYQTDPDQSPRWRIVGFGVTPSSIKHVIDPKETVVPGLKLNTDTCNVFTDVANIAASRPQYIDPECDEKTGQCKEIPVLFTYDVQYIETPNISWEQRWDDIIKSRGSSDQIHWFSIVNSLMIVLFLTGMIAMIMLRTLHRDIARYNEVQTTEEFQEESGWKLVHGDVFRPPLFSPMLFSVCVGTGVQVCAMSAATMVIALLGLLSPANRGSLLTTLILLFVFMGSFAGYYSARTFKMFHGKNRTLNRLLTALLYPGSIFGIFFLLNLFMWAKSSSQAVPFGTLFALLVLWFFISVPLVFVGSYFGFKKDAIEHPVRTNQIARQIPEQMWYLSSPFSILVGGILPFGAVFIELFFIMSALWLHQIYYVFGFLFIVLLILVATCAEVTVVMCYFQLCAEDYRWWWRSFLTSGSAALYLFLYSFLYFFTKLSITAFVSGLLYFGYMLMISITFFFLTGTIGYFACLWFTRKIYGSIKID